ncbi:MAG: hypothetical protein RLZZ501_1222 [Pseudomonadota bacterium]|jgi:uncharacterized protein YcbK (DUF882 family)
MIDQVKNRRGFLTLGLGAAAAMVVTSPVEAAIRRLPERSLHLYSLHTGENLKAVYWGEGRYQPRALAQITRFLRDYRNGATHAIDPHLLDLLVSLQKRMGVKGPIHVVSGYRSPASNAMLANASDGVATHSLHTQGRAIDIRLPGHSVSSVGRAARSLRAGGVGTYPESDFVHVDTGKVRVW